MLIPKEMQGAKAVSQANVDKILALIAKVREVVHNNDWPTDEGHMPDDGVTCSCPILDLTDSIEAGLK